MNYNQQNDFTEAVTVIIFVIYLICSIISFGHSLARFEKCHEVVPLLNSVFMGTGWPLYTSYIYFKGEVDCHDTP